jgi:hypothetical protein
MTPTPEQVRKAEELFDTNSGYPTSGDQMTDFSRCKIAVTQAIAEALALERREGRLEGQIEAYERLCKIF